MISQKKTVLFSVLNWGLGHATRSAHVIDELLKQGFKVDIYSDGQALLYLRHQFPQCHFIKGASLHLNYSRLGLRASLTLACSYLKWSFYDRLKAKEQVNWANYGVYISDCRLSFLPSAKVKSILINHQLTPKWPVMSRFFQGVLDKKMQMFHEIWVPDENKHELSKELSKHPNLSERIKLIGYLSHFHEAVNRSKPQDGHKLMVLLSGPPKARYELKNRLLLVCKKENVDFIGDEKGLVFDRDALCSQLLGATSLCCRSAYSSMMDVLFLGKKAFIYPTKNQPEQEYLYQRHAGRLNFKDGYGLNEHLALEKASPKPYKNVRLPLEIELLSV